MVKVMGKGKKGDFRPNTNTHWRPPGILWLRSGDVGGLGLLPVCHCLFSFLLYLPSPQVALCVGSGQIRAQNAAFRARSLLGVRTMCT